MGFGTVKKEVQNNLKKHMKTVKNGLKVNNNARRCATMVIYVLIDSNRFVFVNIAKKSGSKRLKFV